MPSLTEVHSFSFPTTTPHAEPGSSFSVSTGSQLNSTPHHSIWAALPFCLGHQWLPSWHVRGTLSRSPVIVCQQHSISCITPSSGRSSSIFTYHPPCRPDRPPVPLATLLPKYASHRVDFTCCILSLESFSHSHAWSYYLMQILSPHTGSPSCDLDLYVHMPTRHLTRVSQRHRELIVSKLNSPPSPQIYSSSYVPLEKEKATHSRILAWKIPWTEQPGVHGVAKSRTRLSDQHFLCSPSWWITP